MPTALRVPEHSVARRLSNQGGLVVRRQNSEPLCDSLILIKMLAAGVCGTDLAILSGIRADHAEVLGHEGVGIVLHAPEGCAVCKGDRVIINPVHRKQPHLVIGHSRDGVFRELFWCNAVDAVQESLLVACPKECSLEDPELVLAEPLASVLYSFELLREKSAESALLIRGAGTVGILAAKMWPILTGAGAILASKSETHARWLRESTPWPANVRVCCVAELKSAIRESGSPALKAAILCCSREDSPAGLLTLLDFVAEGAKIDLMAGFPAEYSEARFGFTLDRIRWNNICGMSSSPPTPAVDRDRGKALWLLGHRGTAERHILQAIHCLSRRDVSIADIPNRLLPLEQLPEAVHKMLSTETRHNTKWVKAIVTFSELIPGIRESNGDC